jgi:mRNA interferase RelE/StbE
MKYEIILSPEAIEDLRSLKSNHRALIRDEIERYLRYEQIKTSKSRIKRLRGFSQPQYRLRIDEYRIFYDVMDDRVEILAIVPKSEVDYWLQQVGGTL